MQYWFIVVEKGSQFEMSEQVYFCKKDKKKL